MDEIRNMTQALLGTPGSFASRLLAALGIALVAWIAARLVRSALTRVLLARGLDAKLQNPGFSATLASVAYWLVWLFALPALLGSLELQGLLTPVNAMMSRLLGFVPNLMGAVVVLGVGLLVAQIARQIVSGLLMAAGSERLADRLGLRTTLGDKTLAGIAGTALYAVILLPAVAAFFQSLGLEVIATPVSHLLEQVIALVPKLVSAAVIVAITALLGRVLAQLVSALTAGLGVNRLPTMMGFGDGARIGGRTVSELIGTILMVAVVFVGVTQASEVMGFAILTTTVALLGLLLAKMASGLLVMGFGLWLSALAVKAVQASGLAYARRLGLLARVAILFFAAALALCQAGLPADIVSIAFAAVVGSLAFGTAVGLAIAIGLGGRSVASRYFEQTLGVHLTSGIAVDSTAPGQPKP